MNETEGFSPDPASEQIVPPAPEITWDYLVTENTRLTSELEFMKNRFENAVNSRDAYNSRVNDLSSKIDRLENYLDTNWDDIDSELRDEICEIFGFDTEVSKTVTVTVQHNLTVKAPRGYDWDGLDDSNFDVPEISLWRAGEAEIDWQDSSVDYVSVEG